MLRNDWWHKEYSQGNIETKMDGGGQGVDHPTRDMIVDYVPEGSSLLDVGCCNAKTFEAFKRWGKEIQYAGVDQIPEFIDWNIEHFAGADFSVSDASDLRDFDDNSFDYVLSRHVIDHLPHYSQHFMEMWRVARKQVIIVSWLELGLKGIDHIQYGTKEEGGSWHNQYDRAQMEDFITRNIGPKFEITQAFENTGNSIIIIDKEQS